MVRTISVYNDFGPNGANLSRFLLDYQETPDRTLEFTERINRGIKKAWDESVAYANAQKPKRELFDKPSFNLLEVLDPVSKYQTALITLGPIRFIDYHSTKDFLNGVKNPKDYGLTKQDVNLLGRTIDPLSVFTALIVEDHVVMGKKGKKTLAVGAGYLSFPGAGYLNRNRDTFMNKNQRYNHKLEQILFAEMKEETGVNAEKGEIDKARVLGFVKDTFKGSHQNSAVMSIIKSNITIDEIIKRKKLAKDSWEHDGPYVFIPKDKEIWDAFISSDIDHGNIPLEDHVFKEIRGLKMRDLNTKKVEEIRNIKTTGKAGFMLPWAGRYLFGDSFFKEQLKKHKDHLKINQIGNYWYTEHIKQVKKHRYPLQISHL
ncbi:MAG: hypothetical protein JSW73_04290 [Candidatus Woesearchaeota archaeon]|nr:MAG: hypothetical protein JSW73_04290 [Candidatus Woesearchaeota archaeon]